MTQGSSIRSQISRIQSDVYMILGNDQRIAFPSELRKSANFKAYGSQFLRAANEFLQASISERELADRAAPYCRELERFVSDKGGIENLYRVGDARAFFLNHFKHCQYLLSEFAEPPGPDDIKPVGVPEQSASPIHAVVSDDKLTMDLGKSVAPLLRPDALRASKKYIVSELTEIEEQLEKSNVDRKFKSLVSKLNTLIEFTDESGVISLALHARKTGMALDQIKDQMNDILFVQISSTLNDVAQLASQYRDWVEFVKNANSYDKDARLRDDVQDSVDKIIENMQSESEIVDERIPDSFSIMRDLLAGRTEDRTRAVYAIAKSVENILIASINYTYEETKRFLKDAGSAARPSLVKIAAVGIVTLTLVTIGNFMPVLRHAPEMTWVLDNLPKLERMAEILRGVE